MGWELEHAVGTPFTKMITSVQEVQQQARKWVLL